MGEPELQTSLLIAHSASGDRIQLLGQRQCTYSFHDASAQGNSYVANTPSNLLGAEWIVKMGIYALMDCLPSTEPGQQAEINASIADQTSNNVAKQLQRDYPHAFSDKFGLYKMSSATLQLKPGAKPVFRPKRRVPYAAQHAVDKELDRLESIGVISKVNYSDWAAPIIIAKKSNGSLRICAEFSTGLNDALNLHQYPLPLPEDIIATLNGGRYFTYIDLADAYLQINVDDQSRQLLTINTHRGLYQYNRLPFGMKSAPPFFNKSWTPHWPVFKE
ncbi:hypothetical protein Aduo_019035 [Ancylostoma duodenale]